MEAEGVGQLYISFIGQDVSGMIALDEPRGRKMRAGDEVMENVGLNK